MKRRDFLKSSVTVPLAAAAGSAGIHPDMPERIYPEIKTLNDVATREGDIRVRIKFSSSEPRYRALYAGDIRVEGAENVKVIPFYLESVDDIFDPTDQSFRIGADRNNADIFMVQLSGAGQNTRVFVNTKSLDVSFALDEILHKGYLQFERDRTKIDVNFLLDKETGEIDLSQLGIQNPSENFCFHIFADPQGGNPDFLFNNPTRMKIHNAFLEDSIILANHLEERPLFTLMLGDVVDSQGEAENFAAMHRFWEKLDSPVLYELGNHESRYNATFEPGYDMRAFDNFFAAQKKLNGMEKILYSFNAGKWHFVVWPDPLRTFFWDNHPHYFQWLEKDLEKYRDRPTFVFQHVPVFPIGISPFQGYLDFTSIRKKFADIVTKYGNVKFVLSGHVHIPVKSSLKTACSIRGTNFITLPAAGYRPRGFGEEDYFGGPTQGIAIVKIRGEQASVMFKTVMEEELVYPELLPELDTNTYKLWFNNKWEVQPHSGIENGDFNKGLDGWIPEYIYQEDNDPSVICAVRRIDGRHALYLYNRVRGYQAPGQDRLPQTINRISCILKNSQDKLPVLRFQYKLDRDFTDPDGYCGGYIWIEGYERSVRLFNLVYSAGYAYANLIDQRINQRYDIHHFDLPSAFKWKKVLVNIAQDLNAAENERKYEKLNIDRIVITLGVWTLNEGTGHSIGMYFSGFSMDEKNKPAGPSTVDGVKLMPNDPEKIWWRGKYIPFIHLAGEHRYYLQTAKKTLFTKERERFKKGT